MASIDRQMFASLGSVFVYVRKKPHILLFFDVDDYSMALRRPLISRDTTGSS
jgi:hypothetical protein